MLPSVFPKHMDGGIRQKHSYLEVLGKPVCSALSWAGIFLFIFCQSLWTGVGKSYWSGCQGGPRNIFSSQKFFFFIVNIGQAWKMRCWQVTTFTLIFSNLPISLAFCYPSLNILYIPPRGPSAAIDVSLSRLPDNSGIPFYFMNVTVKPLPCLPSAIQWPVKL